MGLRIAFSFIPVSSIVCKYRDITLTSYFPPIPHIPTIPFHTPSPVFSPGCWSLGLTWAFRRSKLLRFHSILSIRFRYFAKLCNYLIQHHTPLIVFSMEMAPCCLGLMVCGYLYHNVIVVYYTFDVYRSPLSSSC